MSDTAKRDAVLERFYAQHYGKLEPLPIVDDWVMDDMADRIVELEAAIERVRALHTPISYPEGDFPNDKWCAHCEMIHGSVYWGDNDPTRWPCPTLRALEETP